MFNNHFIDNRTVQRKKTVALFFGSFNPIHIGHLAIANYIVEFCAFDELWMVVSPQNPFKEKDTLIDIAYRLDMAKLAVETLELPIKICDIELQLPKPSYTITTLKCLSEKNKDCIFTVIMGADSIANIEHWFNYIEIINNYEIGVYPRKGLDTKMLCSKYRARFINAPIIEVSSTFIRHNILNCKNVKAFIPLSVSDYIKKNKLYR